MSSAGVAGEEDQVGRRARAALATLGALAALVAMSGPLTADAAAATLTPSAPCYLAGAAIELRGAGFTPGAEIALAGEGFAATVGAEAAGAFTATQATGVLLPTIQPVASAVTISATESATGQAVASASIEVANLALETSGGGKTPRAQRTWTISGFFQEPGRPLYAHFVHAGRLYGNMRLGVPTGACGQLTTRKPGIEATRIPAGSWTVQVDFDPRYARGTQPQVTGSAFVFKSPR